MERTKLFRIVAVVVGATRPQARNRYAAFAFKRGLWREAMTKIITLTTAAATALALSACGATVEQKAASGAIAGAVVGGPVGAAVGGAAGTAVGQAQKPN